jgi:hypothetical protein
MKPTVSIGAHVVAHPLTSTPEVGDIVTFYPPKDATQVVSGPQPHVIKLGGAACSEPVPERTA